MDTILVTSFARVGGHRGGNPDPPVDAIFRPRAGASSGLRLRDALARDPEEA